MSRSSAPFCLDISTAINPISVALSESAFGGGFGAKNDLNKFADLYTNAILFSESHSRFVVSIKPENKVAFENLFEDDAILLGEVTSNEKLIINIENKKVIDIEIDKLKQAWEKGLENSPPTPLFNNKRGD